MPKPVTLYPQVARDLPRSLYEDLSALFSKVTDWRGKTDSDGNYKIFAGSLGFVAEQKRPCLGRKRLDLFKEYKTSELVYRVAVEVETSTIENGYNDLLKIMQLLKCDEIDYGVIIFVQNNRKSVSRLTDRNLGGLRWSSPLWFDDVLTKSS